jgi:paraquat-inducible protein B
MSVKASPARIGAFVVGAIVLLVASLVVFGSGRFFRPTQDYVTYFQGSLSGLSVGAPVTYRGIQVGTVTDIRVEMFVREMTSRIPVYFEVLPEEFTIVGQVAGTQEERIRALIDAGLRAQLVSQSLVTGQLAIELDTHPGTPVNLVGADPAVIEIPSIPSTVQRLMGELQRLQLDQLVDSADRLISDVNALIATPEAQRLLPVLLNVAGRAEGLVETLETEIGATAAGLRSTAEAATAALDQGRGTIASLDSELSPAVTDLRALIEQLNARLPETLDRLDGTLATVDTSIRPDAAVMRDLRRALDEFANASRSVRELADTIERNPSVLIRGR